MEFSEDRMLARYQELCALRDDTYKQTEPLEKELSKHVAIMEESRVKAAAIAQAIDAHLNSEHFARKKEIAFLARALGRKDGPLAKK